MNSNMIDDENNISVELKSSDTEGYLDSSGSGAKDLSSLSAEKVGFKGLNSLITFTDTFGGNANSGLITDAHVDIENMSSVILTANQKNSLRKKHYSFIRPKNKDSIFISSEDTDLENQE